MYDAYTSNREALAFALRKAIMKYVGNTADTRPDELVHFKEQKLFLDLLDTYMEDAIMDAISHGIIDCT